MFQFPGCPPVRLWIHLTVTEHYFRRVSPFGYPRFSACLRLPVAFRSLPRPSSAYGALASTLRSCSLDLASSIVSIFLRLLRNENDSKVCCFVSSLCSFQGALKARMNLDSALRLPLDLSDPSKRYRNHHRTTAKSLAEQLALFYSAGLAPACRSFRLLLRLRSSLQRSRVSVPTSSFDLGL